MLNIRVGIQSRLQVHNKCEASLGYMTTEGGKGRKGMGREGGKRGRKGKEKNFKLTFTIYKGLRKTKALCSSLFKTAKSSCAMPSLVPETQW